MTRLVINFAQFREALRGMPAEMTAEARAIVHSHGDTAARKIRAAYPSVSGDLKAGVGVEHLDSATKAIARVYSTAYYARMYEHGTQVRNYKGANRGAARPHPTLVPIVIQERRAMDAQLVAMVERKGFKVSHGR